MADGVAEDFGSPEGMGEGGLAIRLGAARVLSDAIVIARPVRLARTQSRGPAVDLYPFLAILAATVHRLTSEGIFVRGCVTRGMHYDGNGVVYSPALVEAYEWERSRAYYPRTVIHPSLASAVIAADQIDPVAAWLPHSLVALNDHGRALQECDSPVEVLALQSQLNRTVQWSDTLWVDADGQLFLNYLRSARPFGDASMLFMGPGLMAHRNAVALELERATVDGGRDAGVVQKLSWLATYHNAYCRLRVPAEEDPEQYLIPAAPACGPLHVAITSGRDPNGNDGP
jgi:hypothetical protein